ncbi:MAG: dCTP deaminase [Byssovorax sp.]
MILSNSAIFAALDEKRLIIDPEPSPRDPAEASTGASEWPYSTTAVNLRLGDEVSWFNEGLAVNIDLRRGKFANLFGPNSSSRKITADQPYSLMPGKLVLANTLERVELPITPGQPSLAARVEGRSSFARCGLLVHFTAPTIHAGFRGRITLEIINLGPIPILLYPGTYICQLIIEEVVGVPLRNDSQFQGQTRPGGADR